jgi:hypothetical protein
MKQPLIIALFFCITLSFPLFAATDKPRSATEQLRKEMAEFFRHQDLSVLEKNVEMVRVSFLINAKNELVIFDVSGEDTKVCDYVKKILNFRQVSFVPNKQLSRYVVDIRLVKN